MQTPTGEKGGFWGVGYGPKRTETTGDAHNWGDLYLGDTGTAVTTLALGYHLATNQTRKAMYLDKLNKYWTFVKHGCAEPGCGLAARGSQPSTGSHSRSSSSSIPSSSSIISSISAVFPIPPIYYTYNVTIVVQAIPTLLCS